MTIRKENNNNFQTIIVGAGPAGISTVCAMLESGLKDYAILEMGVIGNSFKNWAKETKLLTPSFTSNMFMQPDLNSVTPLTSPAYSMNTEHMTGDEYAKYLEHIAIYFELNIKENTKVMSVEKIDDLFYIKTKNTEEKICKADEEITYTCKYLIWGAGEFFYPKKNIIEGEELCVNYVDIKSFTDLKIKDTKDRVIIIGGYEAGIDSAVNLAKRNIKTLVLDKTNRLSLELDDPSKSLSPYTIDRAKDYIKNETIIYEVGENIKKIKEEGEGSEKKYVIIGESSIEYISNNQPIICSGFSGSVKIINDLVIEKEDHNLEINDYDESVKTKNLFFVGPNIHTANVILCFIYKFRMRSAVVVSEICKRENKLNTKKYKQFVKYYKKYNFYLENVSSCNVNCSC
jgi:putative flavoprotein involved in K+ transport